MIIKLNIQITCTRAHIYKHAHIYYVHVYNERKKNKFYVICTFSYIIAAINHITTVRCQLTTAYFVPRQIIQNDNLENLLCCINANGIDAERCQSIATIVT